MAARYFRVDVDFFHKNTCHKLLTELGPWAPLVFLSLIARAKDGLEPGIFVYSSDALAWEKLGFDGHEIPFTLDAFFKVTGRLKQTSRTPVGRAVHVTLTRYGDWQKDAQRYEDAVKKSRKRSDSTGDTKGTRKGRRRGPSSSSITTPLPPGKKSKNHPHDCPRCGARQPSRSALDSHLEIFHPEAEAA